MCPGHTQTLVVASHNPVKIEAARRGFARVFPGRALHMQPVAVPSGGRPQPLPDAGTLEGALYRVGQGAPPVAPAGYWLGFLGGGEESPGGMYSCCWDWVSAPPPLW